MSSRSWNSGGNRPKGLISFVFGCDREGSAALSEESKSESEVDVVAMGYLRKIQMHEK